MNYGCNTASRIRFFFPDPDTGVKKKFLIHESGWRRSSLGEPRPRSTWGFSAQATSLHTRSTKERNHSIHRSMNLLTYQSITLPINQSIFNQSINQCFTSLWRWEWSNTLPKVTRGKVLAEIWNKNCFKKNLLLYYNLDWTWFRTKRVHQGETSQFYKGEI